MAVVYSVPTYSFLQFNEPDQACTWIDRPCLPVYALTDLQFQVIAFVDDTDKPLFESYAVNAGVTVNCDTPGILTSNFIGRWIKYVTGSGDEPDQWVGYFTFNTEGQFTLYGAGQCFHISIFRSDSGANISCFETCFTKIVDNCYTSILAYRNSSNIFGFNYTSSVYNRVRLPFYCHSPIITEERKDYAKSDGSTILLSYRLWSDFKVKTDYMLQYMHKRFAAATAHSDVRITDTYSGLNQEAIVRIEKMEFNWIAADTPQFDMAQGTTVIRLAAPAANVNSNCS